MPAFRSLRLWYLVGFLFALQATGCSTSDDEMVVKHPIPHLYGAEDPQFLRTMGTLLGAGILEGNQVEVLLNGDQIFPAMLQAIRSAKTTITFETFIYWSGSVGSEFTNALAERARAGVKVHVLLDWIGSNKPSATTPTVRRFGVRRGHAGLTYSRPALKSMSISPPCITAR